MKIVENKESRNAGIDKAIGSFAIGETCAGDKYRVGLGLTLDIRFNEVRYYTNNEFRKQQMAEFS